MTKNRQKEKLNLKERLYSKYADKKKTKGKKRIIKTSMPSLNRAMTVGGFPAGCICEIYGPEGYGKTTLAGKLASDLINAGHEVCFFDVENSLDYTYYNLLGVNFDDLEVFEVSYIEDLITMCTDMMQSFRQAKKEKLIDDDKCFFIVIDTITNAIPEDTETDTIARGYPIEAILMTKFTKRILSLAKDDIGIICLNQVRDNVNKKSLYDVDKVPAGGNAFKHNASVRFEMKAKMKDYDSSSKDKHVGYKLKVIARKAKIVGIDCQEFYLFVANGLGKAPIDKEFMSIYKTYDYFRQNPDDLNKLRDELDNDTIKKYRELIDRYSIVNDDDEVEEKPKRKPRRTRRKSE